MIPNGTNQNSRRLPGRRSAKEVVESIAHPHPSPADPEGSYTGLPKDPLQQPQQDADDL